MMAPSARCATLEKLPVPVAHGLVSSGMMPHAANTMDLTKAQAILHVRAIHVYHYNFRGLFSLLTAPATGVTKSPTAASFVRPTRPADVPQSFVTALKGKYADDSPESDQSVLGQIVISGKVAEEVGFDKVRKQMARLDELKVVILDGMRISWPFSDGEETVADICPKVAQLDISRNLFESLKPVVSICSALKGLKKLAIK